MGIKDIIKELREENGLSQFELAEKLDISQSAVAKWELGKTEPTASYIVKICTFFDISADYLLGLESGKK